jgi:hypothetical protein
MYFFVLPSCLVPVVPVVIAGVARHAGPGRSVWRSFVE